MDKLDKIQNRWKHKSPGTDYFDSLEICISCENCIQDDIKHNCSNCLKFIHNRDNCAFSSDIPEKILCKFCYRQDAISVEKRGVKRKQEQGAAKMISQGLRHIKEANVGDSVRVYLS